MSNVEKILNLYKEGKITDSTMLKTAAFKAELESLVRGDMEKAASGPAQALMFGALAAPAFAASNYLMAKSVDYATRDQVQVAQNHDFKNMLDHRPELKGEDQLLVKKYWDSLIHFAPAIAQDPLAAGAYIKQAIQYEEVGGPPYSTIKDLVSTQKAYGEAHPHKSGLAGSMAGNAGGIKTPSIL